ncbi:MAG: glycogen synthase GlgA [Solobacterium sp.]|nr:glycogen synthase GlgA [Solobacterium sp.]
MKILFVAGEGLPFVKTGGLADVIGSLPKVLVKKGCDCRVVLPLYSHVIMDHYNELARLGTMSVRFGNAEQPATFYRGEDSGVTYYFIEHQGFFERDSLYGYYDDGERFAFFQRAALDMLSFLDWWPDIIHSNDWQSGMIPLLARNVYGGDERYRNIKHVYTIHNLAFQGNFSKDLLWSRLGIDDYYYNNGAVRFDDGISFMKSALVFADKITTVSPTYAREILTPGFGERMNEVLKYRQEDLCGIVNDIDTDNWNPLSDLRLAKNYSLRNYVSGKRENKKKLQEMLGLEVRSDVMVIGLVSRLTGQKGVYMITSGMHEMMRRNLQFVVLGTGERAAEDAFRSMENMYQGRMVYYSGYNEDLAHMIYAGCDVFLMPSMYEPCGISQMISQRYGTLPVVRETGGLSDTVMPYNEYTGEGNGFSFHGESSGNLMDVLDYVLRTYYDNPAGWRGLVHSAMKTDVSWNRSADAYLALYNSIIGN